MSQPILIGLKEIQSRILEVLQRDENLSKMVKKWFYGEADPNLVIYPFCSVVQLSSPAEAFTVDKHRFRLRFLIMFADRGVENDKAERSVQDMVEYALRALRRDETLGDLVSYLTFTSLEFTRVRERDYSLAAAGLVLECESKYV